MAIGVLCALCVVLGATAIFFRDEAQSAQGTGHQAQGTTTSPRHQIYGDPAVMEDFEHGKFGAALTRPGDQLLGWFAQPGRLMVPKDANVSLCTDVMVSNLLTVAGVDVPIAAEDPREGKELKQIVNGLRAEMNAYLANGNGTIRSYWRRLLARTREEAQIYERTKRELEGEKDPAVWEQKNESLRRLGLRTITMPEE